MKFIAGETYEFRGRAVDPETGPLAKDALTWRVDYVTGDVVRPFVRSQSGIESGSFTVPSRTPFLSTNVAYRIVLTATDPLGLESVVTRDLTPEVSRVRIDSNVANFASLDGSRVSLPYSFEGVSGVIRAVEAPPAITRNGVRYFFDHWSDGGEREHEFIIPVSDSTLTAIYAPGSPLSQTDVAEFAVGADFGGGPVVRVFDRNGSELYSLFAFDPSFTGGVRVAMADVTGDGVADVIAGTGPGVTARINIFDGVLRQIIRSIQAFEEAFTGGVFVAAGDVNGDRVADYVITPDQFGGPRARVFDGPSGSQFADFFGIEDVNFRGGVRPALADLNGDLLADLLLGAGFGGGPRVAGFDGSSLAESPQKLFADFFAFESSLRNGTYLTAADTDGDGFGDILAGAGPGGAPRVFILSGQALTRENRLVPIGNFFAGNLDSINGVRITAKDFDGDTNAEILAYALMGSRPSIRAYPGKTITENGVAADPMFELTPFNGLFASGVFLG